MDHGNDELDSLRIAPRAAITQIHSNTTELSLVRTRSSASSRSLRSLSVSPPPVFASFDDVMESQGLFQSVGLDDRLINVRAKDFPALKLSGRVISATFCLPYRFTYVHGEKQPWSTTHRPGMSALYDSFDMLSESTWKHSLIGWTGEIDQRRSHTDMTVDQAAVASHPPSRRSLAPVPTAGGPINPQLSPQLRINRAERVKLEQKLAVQYGTSMIPVWLHNNLFGDDDSTIFQDQIRWRFFAEYELFQTFHYSFSEPGSGLSKTSMWNDFVHLNRAFADRVLETYQPGDLVVVHDYQLLLLPAMLRARIPNIKLHLFLHTPFPSYEYFRCLPHRDSIIRGMLGADTIGFQNITFADHFRSCCQRITLGLKASINSVQMQDRHIDIQVMPLGINQAKIRNITFDELKTGVRVAKLQSIFKGKKIIVSRDRLDPTNGIRQKLEAFAMFLDKYPEWRDNVVLIQLTNVLGPEDLVRGTEKSAHDIAKMIFYINGKHGGLGFSPVRHFTGFLPPEEYYALLRIADLGLVTTVRDGMNATSLEFLVAQRFKQSPLLLSEFSGSSNFLRGAVRINPWDHGGTARAMHEALKMDKTARAKMYDDLLPRLDAQTIPNWVEKLLRRLMVHLEYSDNEAVRPELTHEILQADYLSANQRLLVFDYDGTLTPIVENPDSAVPSSDLKDALYQLLDDARNTIWIVSGRDQDFLWQHFGQFEKLGLAAEHGSFMKYPSGTEWWNLAEVEDMTWQPLVHDLFAKVCSTLPGSVVEKKRVSITWHYRRADPEMGMLNARSLSKTIKRDIAQRYDLEVMAGKANIEVRPVAINKGQIVRKLMEEMARKHIEAPDFVLCLGDDTTDEGETISVDPLHTIDDLLDMFRSLCRSSLTKEKIYGVIVGSGHRSSLANWRMDGPADVIGMLQELGKQT